MRSKLMMRNKLEYSLAILGVELIFSTNTKEYKPMLCRALPEINKKYRQLVFEYNKNHNARKCSAEEKIKTTNYFETLKNAVFYLRKYAQPRKSRNYHNQIRRKEKEKKMQLVVPFALSMRERNISWNEISKQLLTQYGIKIAKSSLPSEIAEFKYLQNSRLLSAGS